MSTGGVLALETTAAAQGQSLVAFLTEIVTAIIIALVITFVGILIVLTRLATRLRAETMATWTVVNQVPNQAGLLFVVILTEKSCYVNLISQLLCTTNVSNMFTVVSCVR